MQLSEKVICRFWSKVDIRATNECWEWKAGKHPNGTGMFSVGYSTFGAHRIAWAIAHNNGELEASSQVRQTCDNSACVNPDHLILATAEYRFWENVQPGEKDRCWEWQGAKTASGYGVLSNENRVSLAHRLSWEIRHGVALSTSEHLLHSCDNPACVNPDHLSIGTPASNSADMTKKNRQAKGKKIPAARLVESDVRAIRCLLRDNGFTKRQIAEQFGISRQSVTDIAFGRTWKHVPDE